MVLTVKEGDELPSEEVYRKFKESIGNSNCNSVGGIRSKVQTYHFIKKYSDKISSAYCYAQENETDKLSDDDRCGFLYYWLGDIMESEDRNNRFSFIIGNMYNLLRQLEPKCNCNNIYRSTSETIFDKSRKIFDYEYNIKALQKRDNCSDYSDGQKYDLHREEAQKEYEWLCENCGVGDAGYCEKIKGKNRECKNKGPVELECPRKKPSSGDDFDNDSAAQQDDEPEELDDPEGILGSTHLDRVKSKLKQYEELSGGSGGCGNDSGNILQSVKSTLQSNIGVDNNAEKILGAWCYTYEKKNGSNPINEYCDYLYYWIGDTLLNGSLSVRNLKDLMSDLFPKLNSWKSIKGCDKIETTADESEFNRRKQVFEYLQQCKIMKAQLKGNSKTPPTQKPKCTQAYDTYLKEVVNALKSEYTKCSGPDRKRSVSDSYCTNFLAMCQQCNPEQLSQLKCEVPKTEESIASNYQASSTEDTITSPSENSSSITPTTVISSIVPIIGLPLTALLLYKVNI
ncbi:KIR protein [Plasmodium coatneyi]|uniref:KIR protein n=1 Tax=Plasmodium coatneyi TaxID=208452 RepID=A0A1B1DYU6_9APIC|nr:KIR protein [Plasmodium coatneyi]ANQ07953.1 KIR protein [Plasmodium coatneyi]